MTENERKSMMILADTIKGEINRMCVTKELSEFDTMYGYAKRNLEKLSKMIYDARFVAESDERNSISISNEEAIEVFKNDIEICTIQQEQARKLAIKALDQISHLKDRPCEACEFHTEEGCSKWECVFEGSDAK